MKQKWVSGYWVVLPLFMMVSVNTWADDLMSTYQLAVVQDPVYQTAVNTYKAEQAALGIARSALLPFLGSNYAIFTPFI